MSRYIDADALLRILESDEELNLDNPQRVHGISDAVQEIIAMPTADVVEVVYCEDCKHKEYCSQNIAKFGKGRDMYEAIHYCSYGERRSDE